MSRIHRNIRGPSGDGGLGGYMISRENKKIRGIPISSPNKRGKPLKLQGNRANQTKGRIKREGSEAGADHRRRGKDSLRTVRELILGKKTQRVPGDKKTSEKTPLCLKLGKRREP